VKRVNSSSSAAAEGSEWRFISVSSHQDELTGDSPTIHGSFDSADECGGKAAVCVKKVVERIKASEDFTLSPIKRSKVASEYSYQLKAVHQLNPELQDHAQDAFQCSLLIAFHEKEILAAEAAWESELDR
jgi:hypothetical protein